jgi:penicillin-binding protein 1C
MKTRLLRRLLYAGATGAALGWLGLKLVPVPPALHEPPRGSLVLTDRHGTTLRETRTGEAFMKPLAFADVPPRVVKAMLAAEDKRFFQHAGVDWLALGRAVADGVRQRRIVSGASTITQQLVKVAQPRPRTFPTKVIEAVTALRLEQLWTKERILTEYLNRVDFGHLNIGLVAAADYYFGKPLTDLTDAEAAFLAGLPKNPARLNPHRALPAAQSRQRVVLRRMRDNGWLDAEEFARALAEEPRVRPPQRQFLAPHFVDLVLRGVPGTGTVRTTLDLELNRYAAALLREQVAQLRPLNVSNGAIVVIDNTSGDVLALVGSENFFAPGSGQFNGATARRSPGSTIKPFTYLLALERGATAATVYPDVPTEFPTSTGNYRVDNYQRRCRGPVSLRSALACSLNIPAVHALNTLGGPPVLQRRLLDFGFTTLDRQPSEYGLGLTLGNAEVRLLDLTNAYAALARLGEFRPARLLADEPSASARRVADDRACWLLADILADNAARVPGFGTASPLHFDFAVAAKTGTSTDYRDNWAMGYTPEFSVGVWVGNFDGSPMRGVSGVTGAAPILHAIFTHLHTRFGTGWYATPPGVIEAEVHPLTGHRVTHSGMREKFLSEHLPPAETAGDYDAAGRVKLGAEYAAWLSSAENPLGERATADAGTLHIVAPVAGTTFVIDPDLPTTRRVRLVATGPSGVRWSSESLVCEGAEAVLAEGEHRLLATDPGSGQRAETWIRVKAL